ncbi:unnamed protein product, partial [Closterium sp. NIES-53]
YIALRYFLVRELQQHGQLRLAYVASEANTADIFTKALPPGDHQRFCTMLACFALLDWSCDLLFSPTLPMGGRPIQFDSWLDDLQLYLLSDSRDSVLLFDHMSRASLAPPATADIATRSQWLTRDAAARLAIRNHLPLAECAHFGQHKMAKALYDADLVTHLCTSDARYRAALSADFLDRNPPPMFITLYFIVRDHFLTLDPTDLTIDLLEQHLLVAETSVVAVGAASGTPRTPFFEGCSPSPLAPSYASSSAADVLGAEDVVAASLVGSAAAARARVAVVVEVAAGVVVGAAMEVVEVVEVMSAVGVVARVGAWVASVEAAVGVAVVAAVGVVAIAVELFRGEVLAVASDSSSSVAARPLRPSSFVSGFLSVGRLGVVLAAHDAWRAEFGDEVERPRWAELLGSGVAAMYALFVSAEGDCYLCVPPDPGIEAAALGASESALPSTTPAKALHTFALDSGASRCFFRDSTTLTPLSTPVLVRLANLSGCPVLARSSTVLPCPAVPSGSLSGLHLPSFSTSLVSIIAPQDVMVTTTTPGGVCIKSGGTPLFVSPPVAPDSPVAPPPGHPSVPRLRGMHSRLLVSGLPRSLPPLPPSPALPCLPSVEGRQRAAPHSSSFPPTTAPLQTLHMDVWGPARVSGQGCECYFLLVVDDYTRYTTVFPLCSKGEVPDVLIPWIRAVRLQLDERFGQDLPIQRLHSDKGGEFSSDLLRDFCHGEGILLWFTLLASPQQNGIAERCIGLVMEVARTSMIHAVAPHFLWPFAVRVWGSRALVRDTFADKLSTHAIPCVFLRSPPDAPGWQFYHPTSRRVLPSEDVTFDESVPFYCLFPYCSAPLPPPPPLFLAPGPPPVDPLPPQGPAPSRVSQVDPLPDIVPVEVATDSGAARGAECGGAEPARVEPGGAELAVAELGGAQSEGVESGGAEPRAAVEWFAWRTRLRSGAAGAGDSAAGGTGAGGAGATSLGGVEFPARAVAAGGTGAASPGGANTGGTGAAGAGAAGGSGAAGPGGTRNSPRYSLRLPWLSPWRAWLVVLPPHLAPCPPLSGRHGTAPSRVSQVDSLPGTVHVEVVVDSGASRGAAFGGAASGGAKPARAEPGGAEPTSAEPGGAKPEGAEPGGAESEGVEFGGAEPGGSLSPRGPPVALLEPGGSTTGGTGAAGAGGNAGVGAGGTGAGAAGVSRAAGPRDARTGGTGAAGSGGAVGVGAGDTGAGGAGPGGASAVGACSGDTGRPRPYFVPLLQQPASLVPSPSPYTEQTGGLTEHREPVSRPSSPVRAVRTGRRVPRQRPPPIPGMHHMALRPSSVPQSVPLPSPPASSLADGPDPESDLARTSSPTVPRLLATVVTDPSF